MDASGQGGVGDGVFRVAGEGHGDGVARSPAHLLHSMEVLRARGEEGDSSWRDRDQRDSFTKEKTSNFLLAQRA